MLALNKNLLNLNSPGSWSVLSKASKQLDCGTVDTHRRLVIILRSSSKLGSRSNETTTVLDKFGDFESVLVHESYPLPPTRFGSG